MKEKSVSALNPSRPLQAWTRPIAAFALLKWELAVTMREATANTSGLGEETGRLPPTRVFNIGDVTCMPASVSFYLFSVAELLILWSASEGLLKGA